MFISFVEALRKGGIPASLKEHLLLLEALDAEVIAAEPEQFYYLARSVFVHDDDQPELTLQAGVVVLLQPRSSAANDLGIRLSVAPFRVVRPRRHAVHRLPPDRRLECWRCDAIAARTANASGEVAA